MKKTRLLAIAFLITFACLSTSLYAAQKIKVNLFYSPGCKHCQNIKNEYLPKIIAKYKDKIEVKYFNITDRQVYQVYLGVVEKFKVKSDVPALLIGNHFLIGEKEIQAQLESFINNKDLWKEESLDPSLLLKQVKHVNLLERFKSFSFYAVAIAGLIDGINPCAFTVIIFFISFLTLMGYRKREIAYIGLAFILAVFLTYLLIGLGMFKGLYELKNFLGILKIVYFILAVFCFVLAYLNLKDFWVYLRTNNPELLKVKLPKSVRAQINNIIAKFYRRTEKKTGASTTALFFSALIVGFLVSLLEAICTGQVYLPTIVFILKEPALCVKAWLYLLLYNWMFTAPLLLILLAALWGGQSQKVEVFFREKLGLVKLLMFVLFLGLGVFLLVGV